MPSYVLKCAPDVDLYVNWSTVVDNATGAGTRHDFLAEGYDPVRLDRADAKGTSCLGFEREGDGYEFGAWSDESLMVTNTDRRDAAFFTLKRSDLLAYGQAFYEAEHARAEALLTPLPDEDDE